MSVMEKVGVKRNGGWRTYNDFLRRQNYPDDADSETVEIAEHYRIGYMRARILKALSYGIRVSAEEMSVVTNIPKPLVSHEAHEVTNRVGFRLTAWRGRDNKVAWFQLVDEDACCEIRGVIRNSWRLAA